MALSREDILAADDLTTEEVDVPEWGGSVLVKSLSGVERDAYEDSLRYFVDGKVIPNSENARAKLVARTVVDEAGNRIFGDEDVNALGLHSALVLNRVWEKAAQMSGLTDEDVEDAKGNSEAGEAGDSISSSPETSSTAP